MKKTLLLILSVIFPIGVWLAVPMVPNDAKVFVSTLFVIGMVCGIMITVAVHNAFAGARERAISVVSLFSVCLLGILVSVAFGHHILPWFFAGGLLPPIAYALKYGRASVVISIILVIVFSVEQAGAQQWRAFDESNPPQKSGDPHLNVGMIEGLALLATIAGAVVIYVIVKKKCNQLEPGMNHRFDDPLERFHTNYFIYDPEIPPYNFPITPVQLTNLPPGTIVRTNVIPITSGILPIGTVPEIGGGNQYVITIGTNGNIVSLSMSPTTESDCEVNDGLLALGLDPDCSSTGSFACGGKTITADQSGMSVQGNTITVNCKTGKPFRTVFLESTTSLSDPQWTLEGFQVYTDGDTVTMSAPALRGGDKRQFFRAVTVQ
jgi:hypothetical protein